MDRHESALSGRGSNHEEPLSEHSAKYSTALETSNKFVERFTSGSLDEAHGLLDPRPQQIVSDQVFQEIDEKMLGDFGDFIEYKPILNSCFETVISQIIDWLVSTWKQSLTMFQLQFPLLTRTGLVNALSCPRVLKPGRSQQSRIADSCRPCRARSLLIDPNDIEIQAGRVTYRGIANVETRIHCIQPRAERISRGRNT